MTPAAIIKAILDSDPDPRLRGQPWPKAGRQFAVMDAKGNYAAYTGPEGHAVGRATRAASSAPRRATSSPAKPSSPTWSRRSRRRPGHLSLRLMAALDAGQAAGGDTRGMQSAAMLIVKKDGGVWLNNDVVLRLQVDDNPEPLKELRRLVEMNARRFRPQ